MLNKTKGVVKSTKSIMATTTAAAATTLTTNPAGLFVSGSPSDLSSSASSKTAAALYQAKVYQMLFHWTMATLSLVLIPTQTLMQPILATEDAYLAAGRVMDDLPKSRAIAGLYLISSAYNCILYFWDPVESTPLRLHHLLSIFLGTLFAAMRQTELLLTVLALTYVVDSCLFVSRFQRRDRPHTALCLRSMIKIHHMATILLLAVSWMYNAHYYGCYVMFLHDITDVSMFAVRLLRQGHTPHLYWKQLFVVPVILATWIYYRVFLFGSLIGQLLYAVATHEPTATHVMPSWYMAACVVSMGVLWIFNVYWTSLVVRKAWSIVQDRPEAMRDENE